MHTFYNNAHINLTKVAQKIKQSTTTPLPLYAGCPEGFLASEAAHSLLVLQHASDTIQPVSKSVVTISETAATIGESVTKIPRPQLPCKIDYIIHNEKELLGLFTQFKNTFKIKKYADILKFKTIEITPQSLKHIFGIEVKQVYKKSGNIRKKIQGFHHNTQNKMSHYLYNKTINNTTGIMQADIHCLNKIKEKSTFFPSSWSRQKVLKNIQQAIANFIEKPFMQENGNWRLLGISKNKITIEIIVDKTGELVTAYPIY